MPLVVLRGVAVAVEAEGDAADALRTLLAQLPPAGPYVVGTPARVTRWLQEYAEASRLPVTSRAQVFKLLELSDDSLPAPVAQALAFTSQYLSQYLRQTV